MNTVHYFIDGSGKWMTRWHCTSGDRILLFATLVASLWLFAEYCLYAYQSHLAMKRIARHSNVITHLRDLRNVFVQCGLIHVLNMIISWFWTPYFAIAILTGFNAMMKRHLNNSKAALLVIQEQDRIHTQLEDIAEVVEQANEPNEHTSKELKQLGRKLQIILERK